MEKICKQCGKRFLRPKNLSVSNFKKTRFCGHSCDAKYKYSIGIFGNTGRTRFRKGMTPWNKGMKGYGGFNKGKKRSAEIIAKMSEAMKGRFAKEKNPAWKGGTQSIDRIERVKFGRTIQKQVFERDNYTCQICGDRGVPLQVDHIQPWSEYVELRFDINNCRTLCQKCHYKVTFGREMPENIKTWGHNLSYVKEVQGL